MNDKIVTHEDLAAIDVLIHATSPSHPARDLLNRMRAAAEADAPPLPVGWVAYRSTNGSHMALWHERGGLFLRDDCCGTFGDAESVDRDRLTPLRTTVTEADVERAAQRAREQFHAGTGRTASIPDWSSTDGRVQQDWLDIARAAFEAAGIACLIGEDA